MKAAVVVILSALLFIAALGFVALLAGLPVMLLWNWLMPKIFGLPELTFLQAFGMFWLTSILFKGQSSSSSPKE